MERQLRLAERRGLLKGSRLSPVQSFGLELMIFLEGLDKQLADQRELRLALASSGLYKIESLFPNVNNKSESTSSTPSNTPSGNIEEDYTEVVWETPSNPKTAVTLDELHRLIRSNNQISVPSPAEDIEGSDWDDEWT